MFASKVNVAYQVLRLYGLKFCLYRSQYAVRGKLGLLKRRFSAANWSEVSLSDWLRPCHDIEPSDFVDLHLSSDRKFFFDHQSMVGRNKELQNDIQTHADAIVSNQFKYFFHKDSSLGADGSDPDWFVNPMTGKRATSLGRHWCDVSFYDPEVGDIKFIWEPSRFAWVYTLVRGYAATLDQKYADTFWTLFESWLRANQPNLGPNYACGQECSIRLFAMCFAYYGLMNSPSSTPERMVQLALAIAVHAERVEKNIEFAISTNTNHSITEAGGIYTAGTLFPEFKGAETWRSRGKRILEKEVLRQINDDGSYIQHSMNYHRLMLQDIVWAVRLGALNDDTFSPRFMERVTKAIEFLVQMVDTDTGRVPNYGANDGALVIPLNSCDYLDFRPVVQACGWLFCGGHLYKEGLWDEDSYWLFGDGFKERCDVPIDRTSSEFRTGGYYTIANDKSWGMTRCHTFVDRPGQADMLHFDLWWQGVNVLRDSGSYMYNSPDPWQSYFGSTRAHNTVVLNGKNQLTSLTRNRSGNWTRSKRIQFDQYSDGDVQIFVGEHYGYSDKSAKVIHRRGLLNIHSDHWLIVDDLIGAPGANYDLFWHIGNFEIEERQGMFLLETPNGIVELRVFSAAGDTLETRTYLGDTSEPAGWHSVYYGDKQAAPTLQFSGAVSDQYGRLFTTVCLGEPCKSVEVNEGTDVKWLFADGTHYEIELNSVSERFPNIFSNVCVNGENVAVIAKEKEP